MILGMSLAAFTQFHVIISLMGIGSGILVLIAMLQANLVPKITAVFLATTVATSVAGFMFQFTSFGPPRIVAAL
jgi:putative flippase GtrA